MITKSFPTLNNEEFNENAKRDKSNTIKLDNNDDSNDVKKKKKCSC